MMACDAKGESERGRAAKGVDTNDGKDNGEENPRMHRVLSFPAAVRSVGNAVIAG
jgi:hypothetical protein